MNHESDARGSEPNFDLDLKEIEQCVKTAATTRQGNGIQLLALLRLLESLHQNIRDGLFQQTLPDNRQALYALLKDIEADGGWPYIHRMRLQEFLANLNVESDFSTVDHSGNHDNTRTQL